MYKKGVIDGYNFLLLYMFAYLCGYDYPNTRYWSLRLNPKMYSQGKLNLSNSMKIADLLLISILFDIYLPIYNFSK